MSNASAAYEPDAVLKRPAAQTTGRSHDRREINNRPSANLRSVIGPIAFGTMVIGPLIFAWTFRDEGHLTAETGPGYWLGIVGASIMLVLFLYPLRKRWRLLHGLGKVSNWFRLHMMLGIIGPALIVLHSNFKLGSLNSALALVTMLTVVSSGLVGRFLYARIHRGFSGAKLAMHDVADEVAELEAQLGKVVQLDASIVADLHALTGHISTTHRSLGSAIVATFANGVRLWRARARIRKNASRAVLASSAGLTWRERRRRRKALERSLALYFDAARSASTLMLFERLFALWHVFHLPLFFLLLLTTIVHIIAVHLY